MGFRFILAVPEAKVARYSLTGDDVAEVLAVLAPFLPTVDVESPTSMRDPGDRLVVAAALAGHADFVVTGGRDLLDDSQFRAWLAERGVDVVTPLALLSRLESATS